MHCCNTLQTHRLPLNHCTISPYFMHMYLLRALLCSVINHQHVTFVQNALTRAPSRGVITWLKRSLQSLEELLSHLELGNLFSQILMPPLNSLSQVWYHIFVCLGANCFSQHVINTKKPWQLTNYNVLQCSSISSLNLNVLYLLHINYHTCSLRYLSCMYLCKLC